MNAVWLVIVLLHFSVFRERYFWDVILPADPGVWASFRRRLPDRAVVAIYRASMFFGAARLVFWSLWTRAVQASALYQGWDLDPGGCPGSTFEPGQSATWSTGKPGPQPSADAAIGRSREGEVSRLVGAVGGVCSTRMWVR